MNDDNFKPLIIRNILIGLLLLISLVAFTSWKADYLCGRYLFVRRYILVCPGSSSDEDEQEPGQEDAESCSFNLRLHIKLREGPGQEPKVGTGVIIQSLDPEIIRLSVLDENGLVIFEDIPPGIYNLLFANGEYFWIDSTIDLSNCNVNIYADDRIETIVMPDDSEDDPVLTTPVVINTGTTISSKTPVPTITPDPHSTVASTVFPQNLPTATYTGAPVGPPATHTPIPIAPPTATSSATPVPTATNAGATPSSSPVATNTAEPDATPTLPIATITATMVPSSTPSATGTIPTDPTATSGIPSTETPGPTATLTPTKRPTLTPRPTYTPWPTRSP